jgi:hypothetical protein
MWKFSGKKTAMTITNISGGEFYLPSKSKLFYHYRAMMMVHDILK